MQEIYRQEVTKTLKIFRKQLENDLGDLSKVELNASLLISDLSDAFELHPHQKEEVLGRKLYLLVEVMVNGEPFDGWVLQTELFPSDLCPAVLPEAATQ